MSLVGQIEQLQNEHSAWLRHNFPNETPQQAFLGLVEELGELAHADLKEEQGIRGVGLAEAEAQRIDSVGDLFIFLMGYCTLHNLDLETCIKDTWEEVKKRDWIRYPHDGRTA